MKYSCEGCIHQPYNKENKLCKSCGRCVSSPDGDGSSIYVYTHWAAKPPDIEYPKQAVKQIFSSVTVDYEDVRDIPKDVLKEITNNDLARFLANYIIEHQDEIPLNYEVNQISPNRYEPPKTKYLMSLNIISDAELARLRRIETKYNNMVKKLEQVYE